MPRRAAATSPPTAPVAAPRDLAAEIGKRSAFGLPEHEAYLNLVMTHDVLFAAHQRLFRQHGLSSPLYNILRILRGHEPPEGEGGDHHGVPSLQVGREMVTREPDVTRLVDRLERMGLVRRQRCERDRRVVYVRLTDAGRALADRVSGPTLELIRAHFAHLSAAELSALNRLLFRARHPPQMPDAKR